MPRTLFATSSYDASVLWKFFDGVSTALATRMLRGSPPAEEFLTSLLCELLDENFTALHVLDYSLSKAKADLEKSDAGMTIDVEFETHEHSKPVESKYSGADLGVVFVVDHPVLGHSRRGALIQAKKLFPRKRSAEFSLAAEYRHFDKDQAGFLKQLQQRFQAWNSVFYMWYNPPSSGFPENDARIMKAYEAHSSSMWPLWGHMHPFFDELIESGFPFLLGGQAPVSSPNLEEEDRVRAWRTLQPALRVSALETVLGLTEAGGTLQLGALYKALVEDGRGRHGERFVFSPLADFFLIGLMNHRIGNDSSPWIQLTEGKKIPMPAQREGSQQDPTPLLEGMQHAPAPKHTITLTLRSTLPSVG